MTTSFDFTPPTRELDDLAKIMDTINRQALRTVMLQTEVIENAIKEGLEKGCGVLVIDPGSSLVSLDDPNTLTIERLVAVSPLIPKGTVWYAPSKEAALIAIEDNETGTADIGRPLPSICGLW